MNEVDRINILTFLVISGSILAYMVGTLSLILFDRIVPLSIISTILLVIIIIFGYRIIWLQKMLLHTIGGMTDNLTELDKVIDEVEEVIYEVEEMKNE